MKRIEACGEAGFSALGPDGDATIEGNAPHACRTRAQLRLRHDERFSARQPSRQKKTAHASSKPPRRRGAARGLVRRATRSRPRAPDLHRRDLALPPTWRAVTVALGAVNACGSAFRTDIGKPRPSLGASDAARLHRAVCHRRSRRPSRFRDLRRQGLVPELRQGDVVIMENSRPATKGRKCVS